MCNYKNIECVNKNQVLFCQATINANSMVTSAPKSQYCLLESVTQAVTANGGRICSRFSYLLYVFFNLERGALRGQKHEKSTVSQRKRNSFQCQCKRSDN